MKLKYTQIFETRSYGRSISDEGWEKIEPEHIAVWKSAIKLLSRRSLKLPNHAVDIEANWRPILRKHERHYSTMKRLRSAKKDADFLAITKGFPTRGTKVKLNAEIAGAEKRGRVDPKYLADAAFEAYLYDFFLILNICAPGCCDLYRGQLSGDRLAHEISISNYLFDMAHLGSLDPEWPKIETLDLAHTIHWFDSVRSGTSQLPQNPMEKTLFALLHIAKLDLTPIIIVWLFYAFESLLQTKAGENFSSLVRRLVTLLELNEGQSKILRRKFRGMYDVRSSIVHGGFEIAHPMHNEFLDKRVQENYERISEVTDYALTTLVAAVQCTIRRGWLYPRFDETMQGIEIGNTIP